MKKKITVLVCIAVMLIPAVLAVILYKPVEPEIVKDPEGVKLVTIIDAKSAEFVVEDKDDIKNLTDLANGTPVAVIPDDVYQYKTFVMRFTRGEETVSYRFYMNVDKPDQVYFKDNAENCYKADPLKCSSFMQTKYAESLYDTDVPILTVGKGKTVIEPSEMTWEYRNVNGDYTSKPASTSTEIKNIDNISKQTLDIEFTRTPSTTIISVFDGDEAVGAPRMIDEFHGVQSNSDTAKYFKIQIKAKWNEEDGQSSFGEAVYQFNAYIMPDAEYSISSASVDQGGLICIGIKNVKKDDIKLTSVPELNINVTVTESGNVSYVLLPSTYNTEAGEYNLTLDCDGNVFEQKIEIKASRFNCKIIKEDTFKKTFTQDALSELKDIENKVFASQSAEELLCAGESARRPETDHKTGYGVYVADTESNRDDKKYTQLPDGTLLRHDGMDYRVGKAGELRAMLSGKVVYVGNSSILGGIVVLDHGNGIRSWYCRIDTSGVEEGQTVTRGALVGKSNNSGFGDEGIVHVAISAGNTFINPEFVFASGLPF